MADFREYSAAFMDHQNDLAHYGVKGMKWKHHVRNAGKKAVDVADTAISRKKAEMSNPIMNTLRESSSNRSTKKSTDKAHDAALKYTDLAGRAVSKVFSGKKKERTTLHSYNNGNGTPRSTGDRERLHSYNEGSGTPRPGTRGKLKKKKNMGVRTGMTAKK